MRIKQRLDDFRVRELLVEGYLAERGEHRVYRVTKRKLTSFDAAKELAHAAGVPASEVAIAGLKDRQGVTAQYMTIRRGRDVQFRAPDLSVETVGFAAEPLASAHSLGNAFEVTLRGLMQPDLDLLRENVPALRGAGLVNYFDEQRFGNLRHGQGWIAQQLMRGEHEAALQRLLASHSDHDDPSAQAFKRALIEHWGDWSECREIAGRFGQHHSVFEYLKSAPEDFAGAFFHISSRLRLIHLYAFQSHIWNRAVADCVRSFVPLEQRVVLEGVEGPLVYPAQPPPPQAPRSFRLPGPRLEDVADPDQRRWLEDALSRERMVADDFAIEGVSGFQLKGEDRELWIEPRHLRVRPAERDTLNFGAYAVKVRFELPRGAYATLVVRRLLSSPVHSAGRERGADRGEADPRHRVRRDDDAPRDRRGGGRGDDERRFPQHRESGESLAPPRGRQKFDPARERAAGGGRGRRDEFRAPGYAQGRGQDAGGWRHGGEGRGRAYGGDSDRARSDRGGRPHNFGRPADARADERDARPGADRGRGFDPRDRRESQARGGFGRGARHGHDNRDGGQRPRGDGGSREGWNDRRARPTGGDRAPASDSRDPRGGWRDRPQGGARPYGDRDGSRGHRDRRDDVPRRDGGGGGARGGTRAQPKEGDMWGDTGGPERSAAPDARE